MKAKRLTIAMLEAMQSAICSALAGDGFDGGDFAGMRESDFDNASIWIAEQLRKRRAKRD